jgi:alpha-beta hydrolase superfamily lysophospholipase
MPYLKGQRGRLHARTWHAVAPVLAQVVLLHGLGEDAARFGPLAAALIGSGIEVHALDLPGHGLTPGAPGVIDDLDHVLQDAELLVGSVRRLYPGTATALFGHSVGAIVALLLADRLEAAHPTGLGTSALTALVLSAAPLSRVPPESLHTGASVTGPVATGPAEGTPGPGVAALERAWRCCSQLLAAGGPDLPIRMLHGGNDLVVPVTAARAHAARLTRARLVEFPAAGHALTSGQYADLVAEQVVDFVLGSAHLQTVVAGGRRGGRY